MGGREKRGGTGGCQSSVPQIYGWRGMSWRMGDEGKYSCIRTSVYTLIPTAKDNTGKKIIDQNTF